MGRSVTTVYARALLDAAKKNGTLPLVTEEALAVAEVVKTHPEFSDLINHPQITAKEKEQAVSSLFPDGLSKEFLGFLDVVFEKQREPFLQEILDMFVLLSEKELKIGRAVVTTAHALTAEQKEKVEAKVRETTAFSSVRFSYRTDPDLIGGIVIRIGDRTADGSVKNRFQRLLETLRTAEV